ncbi:hypothetical protein AJ79_03424 [Helicocarpus griseus UAMH5409]|uniref:AAA+ ATPase domain-containing protein n=1 Tax=Helicocarpus griseus UAMH5409 TaxID=1447875 RepID=A0A2B7XXB7_9EURO|nr:hypothetical protein AJ79_03424 [Helicocarpus griseus UAMH5409]
MTSGPCTRSLGKVCKYGPLEIVITDLTKTDSCEGPKDRDVASSENHPVQSDEAVENVSYNGDGANITINSASGSGIPYQNDGRNATNRRKKRDAELQLQLGRNLRYHAIAPKDEDTNASRKKRRKTSTAESTEPVTQKHFVEDNTALPLAGQLQSADRSEAEDSGQNEGSQPETSLSASNAVSGKPQEHILSALPPPQPSQQLDDISPKADCPPAKTLKLNPNGKLLNSPRRPRDEPQVPQGLTKKRKSAGRKRGKKQSALVILKYGAKEDLRSSLGRLIDDIIVGQKRVPAVKETAPPSIPKPPPQQPQQPQLPPKPTHPFFLGKVAPKPEQKLDKNGDPSAKQASETKTDSPNCPPGQSSLNARQIDNSTKIPARLRPLYPKHPDPVDPIWPPREAVHVRGIPPHASGSGHLFADFEERKAKGLVATIPDRENILKLQSRLFSVPSGRGVRKKVLRRPKKRICSRDNLLEIVMNRFGLAAEATQITREATPQRTSNPHASHPAVGQLLSSIRSSTTAFDGGESDDIPWAHKYAPSGADFVLQLGGEAIVLKRWLQNLIVSTVHTGVSSSDGKKLKQTTDDNAKRKKRRKRPKNLDEFIVSSDDDQPQMAEINAPDDEDELAGGVTLSKIRTVVRSDGQTTDHISAPEKRPVSNSILISGPPGCGKTAAVHAVAKELGFEIFEINPGSRRSARDVVERVGDMTQNHLVQLLGQVDENSAAASSLNSMFSAPNNDTGKQSSMKTFFKQNQSAPKKNAADAADGYAMDGADTASKFQPNQKQSLILLEEVDILFEEDKQFWSGVLALINQSKRPIIMTCNDERLLPLDQLKLHAILRFRQPPCALATDYVFLLAANEGHIVDREIISELYTVLRQDLRATIMQLDFWCQMAVGSKKAGIDWLTKRPIIAAEKAHEADIPRVISTDTYVRGMGLVSQDLAKDEEDPYERKSQLMLECLDQWHMGVMDWHEAKMFRGESPGHDGQSRLEALIQESQAADMRGNIDIICRNSPGEFTQDVLDPSWPEMTGKQRSTYTEGYQLLQSDLHTDYKSLSTNIGVIMSIFLDNSFQDSSSYTDENIIIQQALEKFSPHKPTCLNRSELQDTLEPVMENPDPFNPPPGRQSFSFDGGIAPISEDLAPYIRSIVAFDLRLEQHRLALSGLLSQGSKANKRARTTRASRAALEGGDKASIRKERWFSVKLNPKRVLATGGFGWQDVLLREFQKVAGESDLEQEDVDKRSMEEDSTGSDSEGGI